MPPIYISTSPRISNSFLPSDTLICFLKPSLQETNDCHGWHHDGGYHHLGILFPSLFLYDTVAYFYSCRWLCFHPGLLFVEHLMGLLFSSSLRLDCYLYSRLPLYNWP
ncbi:hypothetical protein ABW21_db0201654 [Orbilia brochopaga]|nr:hypothetical protein ABW21_db0201654 [Drechslerella brochopaga]